MRGFGLRGLNLWGFPCRRAPRNICKASRATALRVYQVSARRSKKPKAPQRPKPQVLLVLGFRGEGLGFREALNSEPSTLNTKPQNSSKTASPQSARNSKPWVSQSPTGLNPQPHRKVGASEIRLGFRA